MKTLIVFLTLLFAISVNAQQHVPNNAVRQAELTADSTNSTTSLKGTPLQAVVDSNATWGLDAYLLTGSDDAAGMAIAISLPSGASISAVTLGTDSTISQLNSDAITASASAGHAWNTTNSQTGWVHIHGVVVTTSGTGSVMVEHKKLTSGVATLRAKSRLILTKIR